MRFLDRLRPELVHVAPRWRTFEETVTGLVHALVAAGELSPASETAAVRAILTREAEASTALLEIGVGVPHARIVRLARPLVSVAAAAPGLYEPVPTVPIRIVALVLSPPEATTSHLETLADVATLLRSDELRLRLLAAPDGAAGLAALRAHARVVP